MAIRIYATKKQLQIIIIIFLAVLIVLNLYFIRNIIKYSAYEDCNANIINTYYDIVDDTASYYISVSYTYNGKEYEADKLVPSLNGYDIGDNIIIKVNPENPTQLSSDYAMGTIVVIDIVLGIFTVFTFIALHVRKKRNSYNYY